MARPADAPVPTPERDELSPRGMLLAQDGKKQPDQDGLRRRSEDRQEEKQFQCSRCSERHRLPFRQSSRIGSARIWSIGIDYTKAKPVALRSQPGPWRYLGCRSRLGTCTVVPAFVEQGDRGPRQTSTHTSSPRTSHRNRCVDSPRTVVQRPVSSLNRQRWSGQTASPSSTHPCPSDPFACGHRPCRAWNRPESRKIATRSPSTSTASPRPSTTSALPQTRTKVATGPLPVTPTQSQKRKGSDLRQGLPPL
jgi:hypothetical protein